MRKGVKFFNSLVPTDLLTLAPAPSAWSIASNTLRILRGVVVVAVKEGSLGGITGRPLNVDCAGAIVVFVVAWKVVFVVAVVVRLFELRYGRIYCRWWYATAAMQIKMEMSSLMKATHALYMGQER